MRKMHICPAQNNKSSNALLQTEKQVRLKCHANVV